MTKGHQEIRTIELRSSVGPYRFSRITRGDDLGLRDYLALTQHPDSAGIVDEETPEGDLWMYPSNEATEPDSLFIENAGFRASQGGIKIELPSGSRVELNCSDPGRLAKLLSRPLQDGTPGGRFNPPASRTPAKNYYEAAMELGLTAGYVKVVVFDGEVYDTLIIQNDHLESSTADGTDTEARLIEYLENPSLSPALPGRQMKLRPVAIEPASRIDQTQTYFFDATSAR